MAGGWAVVQFQALHGLLGGEPKRERAARQCSRSTKKGIATDVVSFFAGESLSGPNADNERENV